MFTLDRLEWKNELPVFDRVAAEEPAGRLLHHADDVIGLSVDFHLAAQRIERAVQSLSNSRPHDRDLRPVVLLGLRKEAAGPYVDVANHVVVRPHAEYQRPVCFDASVLDD